MTKDELVLQHFPEGYGQAIYSYARDVALANSRYIFVEGKGKRRSGFCTHCDAAFDIEEKVKHHSRYECPTCRGEHIVQLAGMGRKRMIDSAYFLYFEKSMMSPEDTIVARGILVQRDYRGDYRQVITEFYECARYVFQYGKGAQMLRWYEYPQGAWSLCKSVYDVRNVTFLKRFPLFVSRESIRDAIRDSAFQYMPWDAESKWCLLAFFDTAAQHPQSTEYLVKMGFTDIVEAKMYGRHTYRAINWNGKTIQEIMRLPLGKIRELLQLLRSGRMITCSYLKMTQILFQDDSKVDVSKLCRWDLRQLEKATNFVKIGKLYRYLEKQQRPNRQSHARDVMCGIGDWLDYIKDCQRLELDLKASSVLFPRSLYDAHQRTIQRIKYKEDKALDEKIRKIIKTKRVKGMHFEADGYLIRPATSTAEIIREGETLQHCVGNYAKRHAEGELMILFVRDVNDPDKPLVTVEYCNGVIRQVRAQKNSTPSREVSAFIELYEAYLARRTKRKKRAS